MSLAHIYLNIGSNSGDRRALVGRAVAAVVCALGPARMSRPFRSAPWGFDSGSEFLNVGLDIDISRSPFAAMDDSDACRGILALLKKIERNISDMPHRNPDGSYRDREIDIDIIAADDDCAVSLPEVEVPHPRMDAREFVLVPLAELAPQWHHPLSGLTAAAMLGRLSEKRAQHVERPERIESGGEMD